MVPAAFCQRPFRFVLQTAPASKVDSWRYFGNNNGRFLSGDLTYVHLSWSITEAAVWLMIAREETHASFVYGNGQCAAQCLNHCYVCFYRNQVQLSHFFLSRFYLRVQLGSRVRNVGHNRSNYSIGCVITMSWRCRGVICRRCQRFHQADCS